MQIRKMRKMTAIIVSLTLTAIILGAAFAGILITKQVPMGMRIKGTATMEVYDSDGYSILTNLALGDFIWQESDFFPGKLDTNTESSPQSGYRVRNVDQVDFYVRFSVLNVPDGATFSLCTWRQDQNTANVYHLIAGGGGDGYSSEFLLTSPSLDPTHINAHELQFTLLVSVSEGATFGTFSPTLVIDAEFPRTP